MLHKVLKIGNSYGVTFPNEFVKRNKIKVGSQVSSDGSNGSITFSTKLPKKTNYQVMEDKDFLDLLKEVEDRYGNVLQDLAHLE